MTDILKRARSVIEARTKGPWIIDVGGCLTDPYDEPYDWYFARGPMIKGQPRDDAAVLARADSTFISLLGTVASEVWDVVEAAIDLSNALTPEERASEFLSPEYPEMKSSIDRLLAALTKALGEK